MRLRRASVLTACLAAVLGVAGCSSSVSGSASSASGDSPSASSSAPSSAAAPTGSGSAEPGGSGSPEPGAGEPRATEPGSGQGGGEVKLGKRKKSEYDPCGLLSSQEVAVVFGAGEMLETSGCLHSSFEPMKVAIIQASYFIPDASAEIGKIEVGGNSAYRMKSEEGCAVLVALSEESQEATGALRVDVTTDGSAEPCQLAVDLATKAFDRIPNA